MFSAQAGALNIYYHEQGAGIAFVAAHRSPAEGGALAGDSPISIFSSTVNARLARVSADGLHLVFVTRRPATGAPNEDADSGAPLGQVFRYDAAQDELSCVSCNPTGAPPSIDGQFHPYSSIPRAAATVPCWRNSLGTFNQQRFMSEDGSRVYFDSFDRLLPADTNGALDVYEWQAPGTGGCTTVAPSYFEVNEGCLSLISTGKSDDASDFIEATPDGST